MLQINRTKLNHPTRGHSVIISENNITIFSITYLFMTNHHTKLHNISNLNIRYHITDMFIHPEYRNKIWKGNKTYITYIREKIFDHNRCRYFITTEDNELMDLFNFKLLQENKYIYIHDNNIYPEFNADNVNENESTKYKKGDIIRLDNGKYCRVLTTHKTIKLSKSN